MLGINYIAEKVKVKIMKRMKGLQITHASWDICNSDDLETNRNRQQKYEKETFYEIEAIKEMIEKKKDNSEN